VIATAMIPRFQPRVIFPMREQLNLNNNT
jgi:hypothetical protein